MGPIDFFFNISGHADGERRGPVADRRVRKDASHRDLSDATLRSDLAPGVRRRHAPEKCLKKGMRWRARSALTGPVRRRTSRAVDAPRSVAALTDAAVFE